MIFGRLALSVPSNAASAWLVGARRPRLGVQILPVELPSSLRRKNPGTPEAGLIISAIEDASPAARSGLLVGDVVLGVGDKTLYDVETLLDAIARAEEAVRLRLMRGGKSFFVVVNLGTPGHAA
jgi:serine protease Do